MQQEILTITQQKLDAQAEIIENLNKRVSELQFNYELLKRENDEKRALMMKSEEIKVEPEEAKEEQINEELFPTFDKFFQGISDMNKGLALKTLKMWLTNIASNPSDKQKSKINTTNPQYKNYFAGVPEVDKLFTLMGFTLKGSILEFENSSLVQVNAIISKATETISSLPSQPFSSSSPWLMKPMPRKDVPEEPKLAQASAPEEIKTSAEKRPVIDQTSALNKFEEEKAPQVNQDVLENPQGILAPTLLKIEETPP